ncbi:MAG: glycosyltransferase family 4 protein [Anaerolineae bacterium]|nr:glycosyltransferase family 4 protein [Anaerolineae bacterium]NUQ02524.1 glycosyltransferase family 4 protein [Anaerolineae bacterium]
MSEAQAPIAVGIDYTPAHEQGGGIGRYVRELTAALAESPEEFRFSLFAAGAVGCASPFANHPRFTWHPTRLTPQWWARIWHRLRLPIPIEAIVGNVKLYHATDFVLPPVQARSLLTVHDLSFVRVPATASPPLKRYLDRVVPRSVLRADHILADSAATKDDLIELYGTPSSKITVLYSGVGSRFSPTKDSHIRRMVLEKYHLPDRPYILSVGTVQPRKNYARLVRAVAVLRERGIDIDVVIAGGRGWLEDSIYQAVDETMMTEHVHFAGFVDDVDLPALYSAALVTALPSLYEGFGIPILESMACGVPVITSNVSSLPEVGGDAAVTISPTDLDSIIDGLQRVLEDQSLRDQMIARGFSRAAQFSWRSAAAHLRQVYRSLL